MLDLVDPLVQIKYSKFRFVIKRCKLNMSANALLFTLSYNLWAETALLNN